MACCIKPALKVWAFKMIFEFVQASRSTYCHCQRCCLGVQLGAIPHLPASEAALTCLQLRGDSSAHPAENGAQQLRPGRRRGASGRCSRPFLPTSGGSECFGTATMVRHSQLADYKETYRISKRIHCTVVVAADDLAVSLDHHILKGVEHRHFLFAGEAMHLIKVALRLAHLKFPALCPLEVEWPLLARAQFSSLRNGDLAGGQTRDCRPLLIAEVVIGDREVQGSARPRVAVSLPSVLHDLCEVRDRRVGCLLNVLRVSAPIKYVQHHSTTSSLTPSSLSPCRSCC